LILFPENHAWRNSLPFPFSVRRQAAARIMVGDAVGSAELSQPQTRITAIIVRSTADTEMLVVIAGEGDRRHLNRDGDGRGGRESGAGGIVGQPWMVDEHAVQSLEQFSQRPRGDVGLPCRRRSSQTSSRRSSRKT
jgi:hypothetical protein